MSSDDLIKVLVDKINKLEQRLAHLESLELVAESGTTRQLQGRDVADLAPAGGDLLAWDGDETRWKPTSVLKKVYVNDGSNEPQVWLVRQISGSDDGFYWAVDSNGNLALCKVTNGAYDTVVMWWLRDLTATHPATSAATDLGTSSKLFRRLYLSDSIRFGSDTYYAWRDVRKPKWYDGNQSFRLVSPAVLPFATKHTVLTSSYQSVGEQVKNFKSTGSTWLGSTLDHSSYANLNLYVGLTARFGTNPTTIEVAIYHYYGGVWQYHGTTYSRSAYSYGYNKRTWGPWDLSTVGDPFEVRVRYTQGTDAIVYGLDSSSPTMGIFIVRPD